MKINLVSVGTSMPSWVCDGVETYIKRFPKEVRFNLIEIPASKRSKNSVPAQLMQDEAIRIEKFLKQNTGITIALDVQGKMQSTEQLAEDMANWRSKAATVNLLVGGPDGLAPSCLEQASAKWSLSRLTMPHPLVRIILCEQLYRAWTILINHPYHRA